jgi:hypothetical protein
MAVLVANVFDVVNGVPICTYNYAQNHGVSIV